MESSLHTFHSIAVIANTAPFTLRWSACKVPPLRKRAHAMRSIQWQQPAETDRHPQASPPVVKGRGPFMLPRSVVRIGAGVALALALGSASWMARCWTHVPLVLQPAWVCVLNGTTSIESMKKLVLREAVISGDEDKEAIRLYGEYRKSGNKVDAGIKLVEQYIRLRDWGKARDICEELTSPNPEELTSPNPQDPRPKFYLAVTNMMHAVEAMLSADPTSTTTDEIEKIVKDIEMFKNATIAWKESIKNRKAETKGRK